jgi:TetR/AcrR family fatty acid metabolism transcriptional regulator
MTNTNQSFQEQVAALRRKQILEAATKVFAKRGFHRTTIRDIGRAAGVADGTIYNYFENKTGLLLAILNQLNESDRRSADLAHMPDMDIREFFQQYLQHRLDVLSGENLDVLRVVLAEVLVDTELRDLYVKQIINPTFALAEPYFQHLIDTGKLQTNDAKLAPRLITATFLGFILLRFLGDQEVTARWDELPQTLTTQLLDGLLRNEGGPDGSTDERSDRERDI